VRRALYFAFMKASVCTTYGPPSVLFIKDVEKPSPKDNEVLIEIHATTVNRTDCGFRLPVPFFVRLFSGIIRPRRTILGNEVAGIVVDAGKDVTLFKKGDAVFGLTGMLFGAHAEYVCVPERASILPKPVTIDFQEATAVCDGAAIALCHLRKAGLQRGHHILIYGASGSIGTAAVQLAHHFGATITAVCNTKNAELVRELGADEVIDYTKDDYANCGQSFDVVYDAVGKTSYFHCKKVLKRSGVYLSTDLGFLWQNPFLALFAKIIGSKRIRFPIPTYTKEELGFIKGLIESGQYRAVIDRRYTLDQIVEATEYVASGQKTGNVVIVVKE
jgi:NADPH:quinone reductase-like Zn-dependent oxidoreductase